MQRYNINISGEQSGKYNKTIGDAAWATLLEESINAPVSVNLLIADDQYLQLLNKQYQGHDHPTDVLAFPMNEDVDGLQEHLGDIAISMDSVVVQAGEAGQSVAAELQLLVVHGILHLLGYDHHSEGDKKKMWEVQERVLKMLQSDIHQPASG